MWFEWMRERVRVGKCVEYRYGCKRECGEWGVVTAVDGEKRKEKRLKVKRQEKHLIFHIFYFCSYDDRFLFAVKSYF